MASGQQPTAISPAAHEQGNPPDKSVTELGHESFPSQDCLEEGAAPADTLIAACERPRARSSRYATPQLPDPQKVGDSKCVLSPSI